jgi:thiosulfate/3-mercaptopyruvate sulfurtransferase
MCATLVGGKAALQWYRTPVAFRTLISTSALGLHLGEDQIAIVDCRFKLGDESWGEDAYTASHVIGAVYAHLDRDLSGPKSGTNGRHPLPDPGALARTFGRLGITSGVQVVAYDEDNGMFASRLWWMLRWLGHDAVAVLDGGFAKWTAEGRETRSGTETRAPQTFIAAPRPEMIATVDQVAALRTDKAWQLIDARAPERFRGDVEPLDKVAGHIPGAVNHHYQTNLDAEGSFRSPEDLRTHMRAALGDHAADHVVCYCGSGVTACHNLLALEHAGLTGAKLYAGSWSEWSSDPARPVEKSERKS